MNSARNGGNRQPRVLMLDPSGSGGGYVHQLSNELANQDCDVDLFTSYLRADASEHYGDSNYKTRPWFFRFTQRRSYASGRSRIPFRAARLAGYMIGMARLTLAARHFDVVHTHLHSPLISDVLFLWLISHIRPVVYTVHNLYPHDLAGSARNHLVLSLMYRVPHVLIVHSDSAVQSLHEKFGVPLSKIKVLRHGHFRHLLPGNEFDHAANFNVLFFGNIRKDKGLDVLLRAFGIVLQSVRDARLVIAGRPRTDMAPYFGLMDQLEIRRSVDLQLDWIPDQEVHRYFADAAVVALPYREIDQSGVAATALSFGKPIVATRVGGLTETIADSKCGISVAVDDHTAMAQALIDILKDRELRERYGHNASSYAESQLSWSPIARATRDIYLAEIGCRGLA